MRYSVLLVSTGGAESLEFVDVELGEGRWEVRSALEWARFRALVADGVSQHEMAEADGPPRYERVPAGSMLEDGRAAAAGRRAGGAAHGLPAGTSGVVAVARAKALRLVRDAVAVAPEA